MLKAIIEKEVYDALPDAVKAEYTEKSGKYEVQVEGMKTQADVDRVSVALTKERNDHRIVKESLGTILAGRKAEEVVAILDKVPELELAAAGKIDDKKINEIVETRITSRLAPVVRERDTLKTQVGEKDKTIETLTGEGRKRTVADAIRTAATAAKVLPEALDDALLLGDRLMTIEEGTGKVITKDNVGVTPGLEPAAWLVDLQKTRPHWWGVSSGGGAGGNRGGTGGGANPWSDENWNMTEQGKIYNSDQAKAEQLAKAAGTTIGGPRPKKKS